MPALVFHPVPLVVPVAAAAWYTARRHGTDRRRVACFLAAAGAFVAATLPYSPGGFVLQSVQVVLLLLVVPPLLLLSLGKGCAPTAGPRRSPVAGAVTHPVVVWAIVGSAVVALYWSGQYRAALGQPAVWQLTQLELLALGCL
ncbi:MAG: cytochrome c oxidase assembly protein, partial [Acidimicrobiales bacterium]